MMHAQHGCHGFFLLEESTQIFLRAIVGQWFSNSTYWTRRTLIKLRNLRKRATCNLAAAVSNCAAVAGSSAKLWKGTHKIQ